MFVDLYIPDWATKVALCVVLLFLAVKLFKNAFTRLKELLWLKK